MVGLSHYPPLAESALWSGACVEDPLRSAGRHQLGDGAVLEPVAIGF